MAVPERVAPPADGHHPALPLRLLHPANRSMGGGRLCGVVVAGAAVACTARRGDACWAIAAGSQPSAVRSRLASQSARLAATAIADAHSLRAQPTAASATATLAAATVILRLGCNIRKARSSTMTSWTRRWNRTKMAVCGEVTDDATSIRAEITAVSASEVANGAGVDGTHFAGASAMGVAGRPAAAARQVANGIETATAARPDSSLIVLVTEAENAAALATQSAQCALAVGGTPSNLSSWLNTTTAPVLLLVLAFLYGGNTPLLKNVDELTPVQFAIPELLCLRFVGAAAVLLPCLFLKRREAVAAFWPACELGVWLWLGYTFNILGLEKIPASTTSVIFALCGPIVSALEFFFEGRKPSAVSVLASCGALAGLGILVGAPGGDTSGMAAAIAPLQAFAKRVEAFFGLGGRPLPHEALLEGVPGEALAMAGVFFFAVHTWRSSTLMARGPESWTEAEKGAGDEALDGDGFAIAVSAVQCVVAALLCTALSLIDSPYSPAEQLNVLTLLGGSAWTQIAACGVLCTGIPHALELFALKLVPPAQAALIYCTIPLWGVALGMCFLGESLSEQAMVGGALILLASLLPSVLDILGHGGPDEGDSPQAVVDVVK
mmetsp:Transcript_110903/g.236895  ORF Transcript_110903/g.236895 Transcript_110903/m.236895 type:complete len:610 (-) Transcript_110903:116-1945(-)